MSTPGVPDDTKTTGFPDDVAAGERLPETTSEAVDVADASATRAVPPPPGRDDD